MSAPARRGRFSNRYEGFRLAVKAWVCTNCGHWHTEGKVRQCAGGCGGTGFEYFASSHEAKRYAELVLLRKFGKIRDLKTHPPFDCVVNGIHLWTWRADFSYIDVSYVKPGEFVIEDRKGSKEFQNEASVCRRQLAEALYGFTVRLV